MTASSDLLKLVRGSHLQAVEFHRMAAMRWDMASAVPQEEVRPRNANTEEDDGELTFRLGTQVRTKPTPGFRIALDCSYEAAALGCVDALCVAQYDTDDELDVHLTDERLLTKFANEVAIMAILPYLRQAIADLTQRVWGHPLMMPMMERGDLSFSPDSD